MTDSSSADDTGRIVLDILAEPGDGTLPSLTREEMFALSDEPVLAHGGDRTWWDGLDDVGRELVQQTAQRGLVARNLLVAALDDDGLLVDGRVRAILRARAEPSWLVVLGEPANTDVQIVASGIDLHADETTASLVSARLAGIYLNRLVAPASAVDILADWLTRGAQQDDEATGRTIEILAPRRPGAVGPATSVRAIVLGDGASWVLSEVNAQTGEPGDPRPTSGAELREWLAAHLALVGN